VVPVFVSVVLHDLTPFLNGLSLGIELEVEVVIDPSLKIQPCLALSGKEAQKLGLESLVGAL
jgi:hypothetical protein